MPSAVSQSAALNRPSSVSSRPSSSRGRADASAPAPDPPIGLLWGYELKRENGYLLERMKTLEGQILIYDKRTQKAEQAAEACTAMLRDFEQLKMQLENDSKDDQFRDLVGSRLASITRDLESVKNTQQRVSRLVTDSQNQKDSMEAIQEKARSLETAIRGLERQLQTNTKLGEMRALARRIDAIEAQRKRDAQDMRARVAVLESSSQVQSVENKRLHAEIARLNRVLGIQMEMLRTEAVVQVPQSPVPGNDTRATSNAPEAPVRRTRQRKDVRRNPPVGRPQKAAERRQDPANQTHIQDSSQSTTQTEEPREGDMHSSFRRNVISGPADPGQDQLYPRKRQKLSSAPATRNGPSQPPSANAKSTGCPSKIIVLKVPPLVHNISSSRSTGADANSTGTPRDSRNLNELSRQKEVPPLPSTAPSRTKPVMAKVHPPGAGLLKGVASDGGFVTQSRHPLRQSQRKLGQNVGLSDVYIELGYDGRTPRPQSAYGKPTSKLPTVEQQASNPQNQLEVKRSGAVPLRQAQPSLRCLPPVPGFETYGDFLKSAQR